MKIKLTFLLLLLAFAAHAKFVQATILFNDGHSETGFVKSFLNDTFMDIKFFDNSLVHELNLDDLSLRFKTTEDGQLRTIGINEVKEISIVLKNGETEQYRALEYKKINSRGEIIDMKKKVWMPYILKGNRIDMYGYEYMEYFRTDGGGYSHSNGVMFYLGRADQDYVVDLFGSISMMNMGKANPMSISFFNDLFKDCPEYANKIAH